ncbi:MAG: class I SAM-dependent methyltransferase [bacterium]
MTPFSDPDAVTRYAEGPRRQVPGYDSLITMTDLLLSEHLPKAARLFILGAGGGLELSHFARNHPDWRFTSVDPSAAMLALATRTMGPDAARANLIEGYVNDAPLRRHDAATCILTMHFVPVADKLATLQAIRARLKPGAPFIVAHLSIPGDKAERTVWLDRYAAFAIHNGVPAERAREGASKIAAELPILSPAEDEALLQEAGFGNVRQFYAGFTFRGWVSQSLQP